MNWKIVFGMLFLLCGVIFTSLYNFYIETYSLNQTYSETLAFQVSGYFYEGDNIVFDLTPNENWTLFYYIDAISTDFVPGCEDVRFQIMIENNLGKKTVIDIIYVIWETAGGYTFYPYAVTINTTSGGLKDIKKANNKAGIFEGIVETEGTYSAKLLTSELMDLINFPPPKAIRLYRYVKETHYPYREVAPVGIAFIILSISIFLFDIKKSRNKTRKKWRRLKIATFSIFLNTNGRQRNVLFQFQPVLVLAFYIFLL